MTAAELIVICAFISPFESEQNMVRKLLDFGEFIKVFIDAQLQIVENVT